MSSPRSPTEPSPGFCLCEMRARLQQRGVPCCHAGQTVGSLTADSERGRSVRCMWLTIVL
eukprot:4413435-Prymnesium_polylepis.1